MRHPGPGGAYLRNREWNFGSRASHSAAARDLSRQAPSNGQQPERHGHTPDRRPHDKLQRGDKPPFALDMFSGENAPVAYALSWCGWRVEPVDWLLNARHDLSNAEVQRAVAIQVQACDAAIWAVDCSTLSRAREVAILGHHAAPRPLRAENEVRGLRTLEGRDAARVEQANLTCSSTSPSRRLRFQSLPARQQQSSSLQLGAICGDSSSSRTSGSSQGGAEPCTTPVALEAREARSKRWSQTFRGSMS